MTTFPQETVDFISKKLTKTPEIGIILGSGLGPMAEEIQNPIYIDYGDIPNFPTSTAPGHKGRFVAGELAGRQVLCMQGRFHCYEGYSLEQVTLPIRCMKKLGIETVLLTNACGGVNTNFQVGDFMLITDHINFMGDNPLIGPNDTDFGPRFCDMSYTYHPELLAMARKVSKEIEIPIQEGVYLACTGPSFETPAEIRAFRTWGADVVGMSTVPEAIIANHCGMKVLAFSCVTNMAAGVLDVALNEDEVVETATARAPQFKALLRAVLPKL